MIHAGVFKQVAVRPETRDSFPGGLAWRVKGPNAWRVGRGWMKATGLGV